MGRRRQQADGWVQNQGDCLMEGGGREGRNEGRRKGGREGERERGKDEKEVCIKGWVMAGEKLHVVLDKQSHSTHNAGG